MFVLAALAPSGAGSARGSGFDVVVETVLPPSVSPADLHRDSGFGGADVGLLLVACRSLGVAGGHAENVLWI